MGHLCQFQVRGTRKMRRMGTQMVVADYRGRGVSSDASHLSAGGFLCVSFVCCREKPVSRGRERAEQPNTMCV